MADSYTQGGGGGKAPSGSTASGYAFSKFGDVGGEPTAEKMNLIDQMLETIFKQLQRSIAQITSSGTGNVVGPASSTDGNIALFSGTTGKIIKDGGTIPLQVVQIALTNAQIATLSSVPVTVLAAQGAGIIAVPVLLAVEVVESATYGSNPSWQLTYHGLSSAIVTTANADLTTNRNKFYLFPVAGVAALGANSVVTNKAIDISFTADPTGAGTASAVVSMTYYLRTGSSL